MTLQRSIQDRNFKILYIEAFFTAFTGIAGAFTSAYAIRLGASNTEVGLMSSLPQLMVILVSIPFGRILQNSTKKKDLALWGITLYRIAFILFAVAPWVKGIGISPVFPFLCLFVLCAIPAQFWNIGNVGMSISVVPEANRAQVFSIRNMIGSIASIVGLFFAGQWLSHATFPGNYQVMFLVAGSLSMVSLFCWLILKYPEDSPQKIETAIKAPEKKSFKEQIRKMLEIYKGRPVFVRLTLDNILLNVGLWIVAPLYSIYTVRHLGASDAWIGTSSTISSIAAMLGWILGRRLIDRWGNANIQRCMAVVMGIYPVMVGMTSSLTMIMIFGGIYNLLNPSYSLSSYNLLLKILPADQREDATGVYNTIMSIGPFLFPMLGVSLATAFGLMPVLIGCGFLALVGSASYWVWRIQGDLK